MELTNIELEAYKVLKRRLDISELEFTNLPSSERNDWVESYKLAKLLYENKKTELYKGYKETKMYRNGSFDIVEATEMILQKKRILDSLNGYMNFKGSLPQFVLLGDKVSFELVNEGLKNINIDNIV